MWGERQNHHVRPDELNNELLSDPKIFRFSDEKDSSWPVIHYFIGRSLCQKDGTLSFARFSTAGHFLTDIH